LSRRDRVRATNETETGRHRKLVPAWAGLDAPIRCASYGSERRGACPWALRARKLESRRAGFRAARRAGFPLWASLKRCSLQTVFNRPSSRAMICGGQRKGFQSAGRGADGDTAMRRGEGEITRNDLKRKWPPLRIIPQFPHHVALPAEKVQDPTNRQVIFCMRLSHFLR
jgi:hypothetical protein